MGIRSKIAAGAAAAMAKVVQGVADGKDVVHGTPIGETPTAQATSQAAKSAFQATRSAAQSTLSDGKAAYAVRDALNEVQRATKSDTLEQLGEEKLTAIVLILEAALRDRSIAVVETKPLEDSAKPEIQGPQTAVGRKASSFMSRTDAVSTARGNAAAALANLRRGPTDRAAVTNPIDDGTPPT